MSFLQIASWNIEHLSGSNRADKAQSAYALADHIEMAGIDIIALQEIYVTHNEDGERRNRELDRVTELLEEHLDDAWDYKIMPNRKSGDKSQLCAVMWNTARVELTREMRIDVSYKEGNDNLWDRAPHALKFSMLMDIYRKDADGNWSPREEWKSLILIPLHMKSNWGGATKNMHVRAKEAKTLCEQLDAVRTELEDESLVLIGDTNVLKYDEPAIETFVEYGLVDLNNTDAATYWSKQYGESPFDRAFVASDRPEFKYTRQYVMRSSDLVLHDRFLSDHYMIKISVKLYVDDTDPRE